MAWLRQEAASRSHPKILKLAKLLEIEEVHALGLITSLWCWALEYAKDGELSEFDYDVIERGARWSGADGELVKNALVVGLLDDDGGVITIHDWFEYQGSYKEAVRKKEGRKKRVPNLSRNVQECPIDETRQDETRQKKKLKKEIFSFSDFPENLKTEKFEESWKDWEQHRREIKKPLKKTQALKQLKMLSELGEKRAIQTIEHTIEKGWQGLREPENGTNTDFNSVRKTAENKARLDSARKKAIVLLRKTEQEAFEEAARFAGLPGLDVAQIEQCRAVLKLEQLAAKLTETPKKSTMIDRNGLQNIKNLSTELVKAKIVSNNAQEGGRGS